MRVSSIYTPVSPRLHDVSSSSRPSSAENPSVSAYPSFLPFASQAFAQAHARHVPVFLLIGDVISAFCDPAVSMLLSEKTVPVHLCAAERPDIELLCQRAGALFSGEGALPLCALLLDDGRPFLAAPLPPQGYPADPARLYVWLSQACRRYEQNAAGLAAQASQVIHSFSSPSLRKPYTPQDAAHDALRSLIAAEDKQNGGLGDVKAPLVCALRFAQHASSQGSKQAHSMLSRAIDAMLSSPIYDPLDGSFFRASLTADWRAFVPEKPLGVNAMMALILLDSGKRSEAIRILDFICSAFSLEGGALCACLSAPKDTFAFTSGQVCAALGNEDGLRACRLLGLLHQYAKADPPVTPSRFSPVTDSPAKGRFHDERPMLYPTLSPAIAPEDGAFLRRVTPKLLRIRSARAPMQPSLPVITEHTALAAAILAQCGYKLGEKRYIQSAQRAVTFLISQPNATGNLSPLPSSVIPASPLYSQTLCSAGAALALALLTLGTGENMQEYTQSGLRLLGGALHTFVRRDGLVMHTPQDSAAFSPRVPAIFDGELPSAAALLIHCLRIADRVRPEAHYGDAIQTIWEAAAPAARQQPFAAASLIDAINL